MATSRQKRPENFAEVSHQGLKEEEIQVKSFSELGEFFDPKNYVEEDRTKTFEELNDYFDPSRFVEGGIQTKTFDEMERWFIDRAQAESNKTLKFTTSFKDTVRFSAILAAANKHEVDVVDTANLADATDVLVTPGETVEDRRKADDTQRATAPLSITGYVKGSVTRLAGTALKITTKQGMKCALGWMYPGYGQLLSFGGGMAVNAIEEIPTLFEEAGIKKYGSRMWGHMKVNARAEVASFASSYFGGTGFLLSMVGNIAGNIVGDQFEGIVNGVGQIVAGEKERSVIDAMKIQEAAIAEHEKALGDKPASKSGVMNFLNKNKGTMLTSAVVGGMMALASTVMTSSGEPVFEDMFNFTEIGRSVSSGVAVDVASIPMSAVTKIVNEAVDNKLLGKGARDPITGEWEPATIDEATKARLKDQVRKETYYQMGLVMATKKIFSKQNAAKVAAYTIKQSTQGLSSALSSQAGSVLESGLTAGFQYGAEWWSGEKLAEAVPEWKSELESRRDLAKANMASKIGLAKRLEKARSQGIKLNFEETMAEVSAEVEAVLKGDLELDIGYLDKLEAQMQDAQERSFEAAQTLAKEKAESEAAQQDLEKAQQGLKKAEKFAENIVKGLKPEQPISAEELNIHTEAMANAYAEYEKNVVGQTLKNIVGETEINETGELEESRSGSLLLNGGLFAAKQAATAAATGGIGQAAKVVEFAKLAQKYGALASTVSTAAGIGEAAAQGFEFVNKVAGDEAAAESWGWYASLLGATSNTASTASTVLSAPGNLLDAASESLGIGKGLRDLSGFESDQLDNILTVMALLDLGRGTGGLVDSRAHKALELGLGDKAASYSWLLSATGGQTKSQRQAGKYALGTVIGNKEVNAKQNVVNQAEKDLARESGEYQEAKAQAKSTEAQATQARRNFEEAKVLLQEAENITRKLETLTARENAKRARQQAAREATTASGAELRRLQREKRVKDEMARQRLLAQANSKLDKREKQLQTQKARMENLELQAAEDELAVRKAKKKVVAAREKEIVAKRDLNKLKLDKAKQSSVEAPIITTLQWSEDIRPFMSTVGMAGLIIVTDEMRAKIPGLEDVDVVRITDGSLASQVERLVEAGLSNPSPLASTGVNVRDADMIAEMDSTVVGSSSTPVMVPNLVEVGANGEITIPGARRIGGASDTRVKRGKKHPEVIVDDIVPKLNGEALDIFNKAAAAKAKMDALEEARQLQQRREILLTSILKKRKQRIQQRQEAHTRAAKARAERELEAARRLSIQRRSDEEQAKKLAALAQQRAQLLQAQKEAAELAKQEAEEEERRRLSVIRREDALQQARKDARAKAAKELAEKNLREAGEVAAKAVEEQERLEELHRLSVKRREDAEKARIQKALDEKLAAEKAAFLEKERLEFEQKELARKAKEAQEEVKRAELERQRLEQEAIEAAERWKRRMENAKELGNNAWELTKGSLGYAWWATYSAEYSLLGTTGKAVRQVPGLMKFAWWAGYSAEYSVLGTTAKVGRKLNQVVGLGLKARLERNERLELERLAREEEQRELKLEQDAQDARLRKKKADERAQKLILENANKQKELEEFEKHQKELEKQAERAEKLARKQEEAEKREQEKRDRKLKEQRELAKENAKIQAEREKERQQEIERLEREREREKYSYGYSVDKPTGTGVFSSSMKLKSQTVQALEALQRKIDDGRYSNDIGVILRTLSEDQIKRLYPSQSNERVNQITGTRVGDGKDIKKGSLWKMYYQSSLTWEESDEISEEEYQQVKQLAATYDLLQRLVAVGAISKSDKTYTAFAKAFKKIQNDGRHTNIQWKTQVAF